MRAQRAIIKNDTDNRQKPASGALTKWEDIAGVESGTYVDILNKCNDMRMAIITLPMGGKSPCGTKQYKPGTKRLVPASALDISPLDKIMTDRGSIGFA